MSVMPKNGWVADLDTMTCRNINTRIVVAFERKKNFFFPKINNMPNDVYEKWANMKDGKREMEKIIFEAESVFLRTYIEKNLNLE